MSRWRRHTSVIVAVAACALPAGCERRSLDGNGSGSGQLGGASGGAASGGGAAGGSLGGPFTGGGGIGGSSGMECVRVRVPAAPVGLDVFMVLHASASMDWDGGNQLCSGGCGTSSKWNQVRAAIETVVAQTWMSVSWGLKIVPEARAGACTVASSPTVVLQRSNVGAAAITDALQQRSTASGGVMNGGYTPTRAGVELARDHLAAAADGNRRLIVLVTDGAPNCSPNTSDQRADDSAGTVAAIEAAAGLGIATAVVGVAITGAPGHGMLVQMAAAGGTATYYPATTEADTTAVLQGLIADRARCLFAIPEPPTAQWNVLDIAVDIDGTPLPMDTSHTNGWDYVDRLLRYIQLHGPACDAAMNGGQVNVEFRCVLR